MPTEREGQPSGSKICLMLDPPSLREQNLGFAYLLRILPFYVHMLAHSHIKVHAVTCIHLNSYTVAQTHRHILL